MLHSMRPATLFAAAIAFGFAIVPAEAVTVREISRACGTDGEKFCPNESYGKPMQVCLNKNRRKLTAACKAVMKRINSGEKVTFF
jgi:hypothetical protein